MAQKKLAKLVETAKGSDRSIREYALAAGVNASTISRIINGTYTPSIKVLQKLTSQKADPRGGVTYRELISAATPSMLFPSPLAFFPFQYLVWATLFGKRKQESIIDAYKQKISKPIDEQHEVTQSEDKLLEDYHKYRQQFSATAIGILYGQMAQERIIFRPGNLDDVADFDNRSQVIDAIAYLEGNFNITTWIFTCIPTPLENPVMDITLATGMLTGLVLNAPDIHRKFSIIVNSDRLFNYLLDLRGKNSYRGNLSIIQVDTKNIRVVREEYVAHYDLDNRDELLII